jgi:hypothetical protein
VYDRVSYIETADDIWIKLCNTMRALLRLSLRTNILIIDSTKPYLRTW